MPTILIQNNGLESVYLETAPYIDGICWGNPPFSLTESDALTVHMIQHLTFLQKISFEGFFGFMVGLIITLVYIKNRLFGLMTNQSLTVAIGDHLVIFTLLGALHGFMF